MANTFWNLGSAEVLAQMGTSPQGLPISPLARLFEFDLLPPMFLPVVGGIVATAGVAEIAAGSIAMGLGGYLAAKTDLQHYSAERARELNETQEMPEMEAEEVAEIFRSYGLTNEQIVPVVAALRADRGR